MRRPPFDRRIPTALALFGILFVTFSLWSFNRSVGEMQRKTTLGPPRVAPEQPYEERSGAGLQWDLQIRLDGLKLVAQLSANAAPISDGQGRIRFIDRGEPRELLMRETGPGTYTASFPGDLEGRITARIVLFRAGASIARSVVIDF